VHPSGDCTHLAHFRHTHTHTHTCIYQYVRYTAKQHPSFPHGFGLGNEKEFALTALDAAGCFNTLRTFVNDLWPAGAPSWLPLLLHNLPPRALLTATHPSPTTITSDITIPNATHHHDHHLSTATHIRHHHHHHYRLNSTSNHHHHYHNQYPLSTAAVNYAPPSSSLPLLLLLHSTQPARCHFDRVPHFLSRPLSCSALRARPPRHYRTRPKPSSRLAASVSFCTRFTRHGRWRVVPHVREPPFNPHLFYSYSSCMSTSCCVAICKPEP
jgi:hypothetical protein